MSTPRLSTQRIDRLRLSVHRLARLMRQNTLPGTSTNQLAVLGRVEKEPRTLRDLASLEQVRSPTMSIVVDRMEQRGWLRREADPFDRRVVRVVITPAGKRLLSARRAQSNEYLRERLRHLDPADIEVLDRAIDVLERMIAVDPNAADL
jgi:DNA-binding MarR family transcriptional regulator